jgi:hypothetical protein
MDVTTLSLHVFSDAVFANNDDFVYQLAYLAFLFDQEGSCALLDCKSMKSRRVTRSILAVESIAFGEAFDRSFVLTSDLDDMLNMRIPIRMYTAICSTMGDRAFIAFGDRSTWSPPDCFLGVSLSVFPAIFHV